jgi:VIT1/CCC1 family predicted Fe2+/Mn2+ transporter
MLTAPTSVCLGAHLQPWPLGRTIAFVNSDIVPRDELEAAIEARKELGAEMEPAVIDAFVERIERRVVERAEESERSLQRRREHQKEMVLGAMGVSIPLLAIAAIFTGLAGVIVVCGALAVIAVVTAVQR